MSTKLMHLRQANPNSTAVKDRDIEDTIQELESRVAKLECQKEALQNKLSMAKQHIMDLGGSTPYRIGKGARCEALEAKSRLRLLSISHAPPSVRKIHGSGGRGQKGDPDCATSLPISVGGHQNGDGEAVSV